jgi:hypothetical protein
MLDVERPVRTVDAEVRFIRRMNASPDHEFRGCLGEDDRGAVRSWVGRLTFTLEQDQRSVWQVAVVV